MIHIPSIAIFFVSLSSSGFVTEEQKTENRNFSKYTKYLSNTALQEKQQKNSSKFNKHIIRGHEAWDLG